MADPAFAKRLQSVITEAKLTNAEFAHRVFVTHPTVSKWLRGMVPRRAAIDAICRRFKLSRQWLLTGEGEAHSIIAPASTTADELRYAEYLANAVDRGEAIVPASQNEHLYAQYLIEAEAVASEFAQMVSGYETLADQSDTMSSRARTKIRELTAEYHAKIEALAQGIASGDKKSSLQKSISRVTNSSMAIPSTISQLLKRVALAVAKPGAKKKLAATLGVSPQHLSAWLSGEFRPGGEATLKMLAWVQANEAQQKQDPEGARTPPGPMTQRRSSIHEKTNVRSKKTSHAGAKHTTKKR